MTPDEQHRVEKIVKVLHWVLVVFATWFLLMAGGQCSAQEVNLHLDKLEPNYGLAVTGTGMTLCAIGTTMSQSPQAQYNGQYGLNYWLHMPGTRVAYDHNRLEYFDRKKNYNASKDDIETLMQRVRPDEKYMIMSMRKETKGMMPGPNMEKVIWKYEQHCKWLSDEFSIEELIKILVADVV